MKKLRCVAGFLLIFFYVLQTGLGQNKLYLQVLLDPHAISAENYLMDSSEIRPFLQRKISGLLAGGYTTAAIDSVCFKQDTCRAYLYKGRQWLIRDISVSPDLLAIMEEAGIRTERSRNTSFDSTFVYALLSSAVASVNKKGYPFAAVFFTDIDLNNGQFSATLAMDTGPQVLIDTIQAEGNLKIKPWFLYRTLQLRKGAPYYHALLNQLERKIADLPYCIMAKKPVVRFQSGRAAIMLNLDKKPANRFDFLIGLQPQPAGAASQFVVTGDFLAETHNLLEAGEYSLIQLKRIKSGSLEMSLKSTIPYIANLPLGSYFDFHMFKNQSLNLDVFLDAGAQFSVWQTARLQLFGSFRASSLIEVNPDEIVKTGKLPSRLDSRYRGLGITLQSAQLDNRVNPAKGFQIEAGVNAGTRSILPNRQITSLEGFSTSYDSLKAPVFQADIYATGASYFPISNRFTLKTGIQAVLKYNATGLLSNEYRRVGGNRTLRGFDEESLFTDRYMIATAEMRFILDRNSYLTIPFADVGWVHLPLENNIGNAFVVGTGFGLSFNTSAGLFNLTFAAGYRSKIPFSLASTKVHFGYVSLF